MTNTDQDRPSEPVRGRKRVLVVGLGGGGSNAVARMAAEWTTGPELVAINTDTHALEECSVPRRIQIGRHLTNGSGAGGDVTVGRLAAEDAAETLRELLYGADLVFLVTALGGGTGTGGAPVVARLARELDAIVIAVAMLPFEVEGDRRRQQAEQGLLELQLHADMVVCLPNQRLVDLVGSEARFSEAFRTMDKMVGSGIRMLWKLLTEVGIIHLDFTDLRHMVEHADGLCVFGYGEGTGESKAEDAVAAILEHPLLDRGQVLSDARAFLLSIQGGDDLTLRDVKIISGRIQEKIPANMWFSVGATLDAEWTGRVAATLLAAERWKESTPPDESSGASAQVTSEKPSAGKIIQPDLFPEETHRGRFHNTEPTVLDGEDYDEPTYLRRRVKLSTDR